MTWIDTNVMVALWEADHALQTFAVRELTEASRTGTVAISGCVYAEFVAGPMRPLGAVWASCMKPKLMSRGTLVNLFGG
jgi:hypothetical protein